MKPSALGCPSIATMNGQEKSENCKIYAAVYSFQRLERVLLWSLPVRVHFSFQQNVKRFCLINLVLHEPAIVLA